MKVLFVCTGNTCRSPMAEGIFNKIVKDKGINNLYATSAGIFVLQKSGASENAIEAAKEIDIFLNEHKARQIDEKIIADVDLIITMTNAHKMALNGISKKIITLKKDGDIKDPFGMGIIEYRATRDEIFNEIQNLFENGVFDENRNSENE